MAAGSVSAKDFLQATKLAMRAGICEDGTRRGVATASVSKESCYRAPGSTDSSALVKVYLCLKGPVQAGMLSTDKDLDSRLQLPNLGSCSSALEKQD